MLVKKQMIYVDVPFEHAWKVPVSQELLNTRMNKGLSLWNKIKYLNLNILRTRCCKPLIFQTQII